MFPLNCAYIKISKMHSVALSSYPYVLIAFRVVSVNSSMETTTSSPARTCTHRRPFDADCPTPPLEVERVVVLFVVADSDGARNVVFEAAAAVKLIFSFLLLRVCARARCLACRAFARTGLTVDWKYPKKKRSSYSCAHDSSTSLFQLVQGPFLGLLFRV